MSGGISGSGILNGVFMGGGLWVIGMWFKCTYYEGKL